MTKSTSEMRAIIDRAYPEIDTSTRSDAWIRGFYLDAARRDKRIDKGTGSEFSPDPDDTDHRARRGANSAVRNVGMMPDVESMDLRALKGLAISVGAYDQAIRGQLADAVVARFRELGSDQLADLYAALWDDEQLALPSDTEMASRLAGRRSGTQARAELASPSRADELRRPARGRSR